MTQNGRQKVFVGLSGGVDSSVAALLLQREGYEVVGVHIRGYNIDGCGDIDAEYARRSAEVLKIPFYVWNMEEEYKTAVVDYMVSSYKNGITPNPDVMCNKEIKFGLFMKRAMETGADFIATGHYVLQKQIGTNKKLFIANDLNKDQTYFLWTLSQDQINRSLFPAGPYQKSEIRTFASFAHLPTANKKDSQGICFLGDVSMRDFLKNYIPTNPGPIVTTDGKIIGEHEGLSFYTIGQRHLGVKVVTGRVGNEPTIPRYVIDKDIKTNSLIVAEGAENPALFSHGVDLAEVSFTSREIPNKPIECMARVRYRQPLFLATLSQNDGKWRLDFKDPQKFIAKGQSAVFYSEQGEMLGGGVIV